MKSDKRTSRILLILLILFMAGCAVKRVGVSNYTGFTELPFPSNNYAPGQIVEIFSLPRKVDITFKPDINWDQATSSPGWNISNDQTKGIKTAFSTEIASILKANYSYASSENVKVEFTNTKTTVIEKSVIYSAIKKALKENQDLNEQIKIYMKDGTRFDVITQILSANISFKLVDSSNTTVDVNSDIIKEINSKFDIDFKKDNNSSTVITGSNLVVGIHSDPKLVKLIMDNL